MTSTTESAVVTVPLRIGGDSVEAAGGRYIVKTRRLTGEPIARVAAATRADAERAVAAAADAAAGWAATSPGARRKVLERAAALLDERSEAISAMMRPTMVEPVKLTHRTALCAISASTTSAASSAALVTRFAAPAGMPASMRHSMMAAWVAGVSSDALSTTVLP